MEIRVNSLLPAVAGQVRTYVKPLAVVLALAALAYTIIQVAKSLRGRVQPDPKQLHQEGLEHFKNKHFDEAIKKFTLALECKLDKKFQAIILSDRAAAYSAIEKPAEAEADFELALQCNPDNALLLQISLKRKSVHSPQEKDIDLSEPLQTRFNDAIDHNKNRGKNSQAIILSGRAATQPHKTLQTSNDAYEALFKLFRKLGEQIPEIQGLPKSSAETIRAWMQANSEKLHTVTNLDLSHLSLVVLPPEIGLLIGLQELNLQNNQLTKLPPEIGKLIHLRGLNLGGNQFTEFPQEIGPLTNLEWLYLWCNQLRKLPPTIDLLINLRWLDLRRNQLTVLPSEIGKLTKLYWLHLSRNQLTALTPEIGKLVNLRYLFLEHNQLIMLPPAIDELDNLWLYLDDNPIAMAPPTIGFLFHSIGLECSSNQITQSDKGDLINLLESYRESIPHTEQSIDLPLGDKQLTVLPSEIGLLIDNLQCFDLERNQNNTAIYV